MQDNNTVHAIPPGLTGVTACCGRTPSELPTDYRMTSTDADVTCDGPPMPLSSCMVTRGCSEGYRHRGPCVTVTADERDASPSAQLLDQVWCETCQHTHIATIPTTTLRCADCGFGAWSVLVAASHAAGLADHVVYPVVHRIVPGAVALCSQCGERLAVMVKIGTAAGWCTACLDEAAEPDVSGALREHREEWAAYIEQWSVAVGPTPPTVELVVAALRQPRPPFGRAAAGV